MRITFYLHETADSLTHLCFGNCLLMRIPALTCKFRRVWKLCVSSEGNLTALSFVETSVMFQGFVSSRFNADNLRHIKWFLIYVSYRELWFETNQFTSYLWSESIIPLVPSIPDFFLQHFITNSLVHPALLDLSILCRGLPSDLVPSTVIS